jgi:RNA polymerase sigma factor (sigma-70 family)
MTEPTSPKLDANSHDLAASIDQLIGDLSPGLSALCAVLSAQNANIERLSSRVATGPETPEQRWISLREAVIDLVLVELYQEADNSAKKRRLVDLLWERLAPTLRHLGQKLVSRNRRHDADDRLDDLMQEGYFVFEDKLGAFDADKGVRLRTYLSTCFRNHFINLVKSEQRKNRATSSDELEKVVQKQQFSNEQMKLVNDILDRESRRGSDIAERVQAFRKYRLEGYTMEEVKQEMGRSLGWVHGCSKSIEQLLRDEMQR